jgi:serine/threonine-protein kinase
VDRYEVEALLGAGGMGAVYRARHSLLGQPVALKLLRADLGRSADIVERFTREAQAAAAIGSPHIVRATDFGVTPEGQAFMVMELLEGRDLESLLQSARPLPVPRALDVARQLLAGLAAAHERGIVHRDLKPANVFLCDGGTVKLLDFGVSKFRGAAQVSTLTRTGVIMGTPQFMAPEQFRGARDVDHRADLYSAAVTIYQMLSGALPFDATTYERLILQVCTEAPRPLAQAAPHVPMAIVRAVEKAMAREPADRYPTAAAFAAALEQAKADVALAQTSELLHVPGPVPPALAATVPAITPQKPESTLKVARSRAPIWIGAALLFAAGAGGAVLLRRGERGEAAPAVEVVPDAALRPPPAVAPPPPPDAAPPDAAPPDAAPPDAAPAPTARERPRPAPRVTSVAVAEPRVVGQLSARPLRDALARADLDACRGAAATTVEVQFHVHTTVHLAAPAPDNRGDAAVARCVANRVKDEKPVWPDGTSGIIFVVVTLPAR